MTRLREDDICHISHRMQVYNQELIKKVGGGLDIIAAHAAETDLAVIEKNRVKEVVGIVPITTGDGIIGGFSKTIESIFSFLGVKCFVTEQTDVAGMAEAATKGATMLFIADDITCSLIHMRTGSVADNSVCTGKGFAAALMMKIGDLKGKSITVLGAGPVGTGAVNALVAHGADVVVYDILPEKTAQFKHHPHVKIADSLDSALRQSKIYFEATTTAHTITAEYVNDDVTIAAPGVPLGVDEVSVEKYEDNIIHDVLEIGVASMLFTILGENSIII